MNFSRKTRRKLAENSPSKSLGRVRLKSLSRRFGHSALKGGVVVAPPIFPFLYIPRAKFKNIRPWALAQTQQTQWRLIHASRKLD